MKKLSKIAIGLSALFSAYLLYPSESPKIEEPVKIEKKTAKSPKIKLEKYVDLMNNSQYSNTESKQEIAEPEEKQEDLPSCLRCDDWRIKNNKTWNKRGRLKTDTPTACGQKHGEELHYGYAYGSRQVTRSTNYFCGKKHGTMRAWMSDGNRIWIKHYEHGKLDGKQTRFNFVTNELMCVKNFKNGMLDGKQDEWHSNGRKKAEYYYDNGKKIGNWTTWNHEGEINIQETYNENGKMKSMRDWADGMIRVEQNYKQGVKHGEWIAWYGNGQKFSEKHYVDGKLHGWQKMWHSNGRIHGRAYFEKGIPQGEFIMMDAHGNLMKKATYIDGQRQGIEKIWHDNGRLKELNMWLSGKRHGEQKEWWSNGQIWTQKHYLFGVRHGDQDAWTIEGLKQINVLFDTGKRIHIR